MPHLGVADRVKETTTTTGTGTIDLAGAVEGYQTFVAGIGNGHETYYSISNRDADEWEVGYGTISDSTPDTLSRSVVISSSNGGSLVNFSAGTKDVICTLPADRSFVIDDEANVSVTANVTATAFSGDGSSLTALNISTDSTPSLGGNLDLNSNDITGTGNIDITGTATVSGDLTVDTSTLKVDSANNRVGIGTSSPSSVLHIFDIIPKVIIEDSNNSTGGTSYTPHIEFNALGDNVGSVGFSSSGSFFDIKAENYNSAPIRLLTGGSERMRITSGGFVGIGVTSPNEKMQLNSSGSTFLQLTTTNTGTANDNGLYVGVNSGGTGFVGLRDTNGNPLLFQTENTERMRIDSSGNVGIGTDSPVRKLEIAGNNNGGAKANYIRITDTDTSATLGNQQGGIEFYTSDSGQENVTASIENLYAGSGAGSDLTFNTAPNGSSGVSERMRIDSSGNVGIGTSSPAQKLDIDTGNLNFSNAYGIEWGTNNSVRGSASSNLINFRTAGSERMRIDSSGNVGIGTSTPSHELDIQSSGSVSQQLKTTSSSSSAVLYLDGGASSDSSYRWLGGGTTYYQMFRDGSQSQDLRLYSATDTAGPTDILRYTINGDLRFATNASERMRIDSDGNVGIGTSSPSGKLDVQDNTGSLSASNDITAEFVRADGTYGPRLQIRHSTTGSDINHTYVSTASNLTFSIGGTERMRIDSSGNVGIGTSSPPKNLTVEFDNADTSPTTGNGLGGGAAGDGLLIENTNTTVGSYANLDFRSGTADGRIAYETDGTNDGNFHFINDNATTNLFIQNDGKVGIGTTSPSHKLDIEGSSDVYAELKTTTTTSETGLYFSDSANTARGKVVYDHNNDSMFFDTLSSERMRIDSSGNVGIGTSSPSTALDVSGTVTADGLTVDGNATVGTDTAGIFSIKGGSGTSSQIRFLDGGTGRARIGVPTGSTYLSLSGSDTLTADVVVNSSGDVGIGTTSPGEKLEVHDTAMGIKIKSTGSTGYTQGSMLIEGHESNSTPGSRGQGIYLFNHGNDLNWYMGTAYAGGGKFSIGSLSDTAFQASTNELANSRLVIDTSGNVGIGTTSPASLLELEGNSTTAKIHIESTSSGTTSFDGSGAGLLLTAYGMNTSSKFTPAIQFGSTDPQLATTNPKVGAAINAIATESYGSDTDGGMALVFYTTPNNPGTGQTTTQRMLINNNGDISFYEDTGTTTKFIWDASTERLGIGTNSPTQTLDVAGTILTDKAYIALATLTDGATINWDMADESVAKVTLGGNRTIAAPTNGSTGQFASITVIQDGTGSRTLTWNAVYEFKDDTAPTLTTTGGKGDLFVFQYNGTKWLEVGRNLNLTQS